MKRRSEHQAAERKQSSDRSFKSSTTTTNKNHDKNCNDDDDEVGQEREILNESLPSVGTGVSVGEEGRGGAAVRRRGEEGGESTDRSGA